MGYFSNLFSKEKEVVEARNGNPLFSVSYDGEQTTGGLGAPIKYDLDYQSLRLRSWQSYLTSPITQTIIKKFTMWVVGGGLKLQSEPIEGLLKESGITIGSDEITRSIESRFKIYSKQKTTDFSEKKTLDQLAKTAYVNSIVGGDVLVVLRYEKGNLSVQLIDGSNVITPRWGDEMDAAEKRNNKIINGVETDSRGRTVAFHVKTGTMESERVLAKSKSLGKETAFLIYGTEYRISDNRGLPMFSAVLETITKIERYRDAVVDGAEERAKVPYFIEHDILSTGESPMGNNIAKAFNLDNNQEIATDVVGNALADNVAVSMNKQVYNMPQGSTMKAIESKGESNFGSFYSVNVNAVCSTIGIPPDIALSKYDSNYSASRAAIKDWEHTLLVNRKDFSSQFYEKIYEFWLDTEVLKQNIQVTGYINALAKNDNVVLSAFRNARFVGANVPHIDPLKEVQAERLKLGNSADSLPFTTVEAATEALNGGDSKGNLKQYSAELKEAKELGVDFVVNQPKEPVNEDKNDATK